MMDKEITSYVKTLPFLLPICIFATTKTQKRDGNVIFLPINFAKYQIDWKLTKNINLEIKNQGDGYQTEVDGFRGHK